jgi:hypothetical protein
VLLDRPSGIQRVPDLYSQAHAACRQPAASIYLAQRNDAIRLHYLNVGERRHLKMLTSSYIHYTHIMNIISVKELASLIKQERIARAWTQAELAERSGVSRDWIITLAQAKRRTGARIAHAKGVESPSSNQ